MLAYRNFEAHELKSASLDGPALSSQDELIQFIRTSASNLSQLQSADTAAYLGLEIGKALLDLTMKSDMEVRIDAPLAAVGLDSLVSLELKSWIRRWMGIELATLEILNCTTLLALGTVVQGNLVEKYIARA